MLKMINRFKALIYPRRCPFCDCVLGELTRCEKCEAELDSLWLQIPRLPASEHKLENLSGAAAILKYEGIARVGILRMKNAGRACYANLFAAEMARRIFGCVSEQKNGILVTVQQLPLKRYDIIVPVPSYHKNERGYNVPDLLAKELSRLLEIDLEKHCLVKKQNVEKQEGKNARERLANVKGVFSVVDPDKIEGRRVLLVDDVITTGATVSECAAQLVNAGAIEVFAVSVAETQYKGDLSDKCL